jgi:hypothetical protein
VTGGKPIAVLLQFTSVVSAINPIVAFYDIRERCYSFILSRTPHETRDIVERLYMILSLNINILELDPVYIL